MTEEIPQSEPWQCPRCKGLYAFSKGTETETGCIACRPTERPLNPFEARLESTD